jgi:hypothetical protein
MVAGKIAPRLIMANKGFATSLWVCRNIKSYCLIAMNFPFIAKKATKCPSNVVASGLVAFSQTAQPAASLLSISKAPGMQELSSSRA